MNCPACAHENRDGARFCEDCGERLARRCASCDVELRAGARFCDACGTPVDPAPGPAPREAPAAGPGPRREASPVAAPAERSPRDYTPPHLAERILRSKSALEGERKQVSVLFADVKGSMELSEQVDPETWHGILEHFFQILSDGVHRFEGTVNQYTGDGIMALFGAPIAHEDHAQRACYSALHLRDALKKYADELRLSQGLDFSVRIGINSGEVVVGKIGDDLRMDYTAQGQTVGLAQRMEQLAAAHSICVSEHTQRLASGYVSLRDLGTASVKGLAEPVQVFELEGMGDLQTRFDVSRARGLTQFVGRDADLQVLEQALEQANAGNGQVVGVVAEAGTGKSRLCFEFTERCRARGLNVYQGSGVAHGKNIPLLPIMQVFRAYFGIGEKDDDRAAREKIAGRLLLLDEGYRESLPLVFDLMGVADPEQPAPSMQPDARQRQLFAVQRRLVQARDRATANVTLIEDLHWIDAASEAWLENMVEAVSGAKSLLLVNFRPEYHAPWMQKSCYRQLPLHPLGPEAIRELLADLLGADRSLEGLAEAIHERTAGNPFFTEEVVQALIEGGNLEGTRGAYRLVTPVQQLEVPSTVQSVLSARIDRLPEREKQLLQTASVIGKEFPEPILEAIAELPGADLGASLQALKDGEFIYQQSLYPVSEYAFKHPLTQEVALGSQLQERRRRIHGAVARAIEQAHPEKLDERAALLAHHYESAGEELEAVRWHRRAAEWLLDSDVIQAIAHWRRVHALAGALPATREAMEHAVKACEMLLSNGWRTGITEEDCELLAREGDALAERLGDRRALFSIQMGISTSAYLSGTFHTAWAPGRRALELADELGDLECRAEARNIVLDHLWHAGRFDEFMRLTGETVALVGDDFSIGMARYGLALPAWAVARRGFVESWLGRPAEATASLERGLQVARDLGQHEMASWCLGGLIDHAGRTGLSESALGHAERALEFADRAGSPFTLTMAQQYLGCAHLVAGEAAHAVEPLERAEREARERRLGRHAYGQLLAQLSEAYRGAGDGPRAVATAEKSVAFSRASKTWLYEILGELARARALREIDAAAHRAQIGTSLARCEELVHEMGARAMAPFLAEERGRLAASLDDAAAGAALLREAHRGFGELGADGHAARLARELGA